MNLFYKNYSNKLIVIFKAIKIILLIVKLIIKLISKFNIKKKKVSQLITLTNILKKVEFGFNYVFSFILIYK